MDAKCEVAIIGAGPYGLSGAAHLRGAGVNAQVFGRTMDFWSRHMPAGMLLRSSWDASHLSDPDRKMTLDDYERVNSVNLERPLPLTRFVEYGRWFQKELVPDVDSRRVTLVERTDAGFALTLDDGQRLAAGRVVCAAGIARFAFRPPEFNPLPCQLVSHSAEHDDLSRFAGASLMVVGAGQSAVETAAIASERGAEVELVARTPHLRWLDRSSRLHRLPPNLRQIFYHHTDVGPALISQLVAHPRLFRLLTRSLQDRLAYRSIRPAASSWLKPRVGKVQLTLGTTVESCAVRGNRVDVKLSGGARRRPAHVILATGYRVDVSRYGVFSPALLERLRVIDGYPLLHNGLESSVPGLHFLGAPAAWSFGPLLRFVSGADFAARALTHSITHSAVKRA